MKTVKFTTKSELKLSNIECFIKRKVTKFGNSAKVDCPKDYLDKKVYLVIVKE